MTDSGATGVDNWQQTSVYPAGFTTAMDPYHGLVDIVGTNGPIGNQSEFMFTACCSLRYKEQIYNNDTVDDWVDILLDVFKGTVSKIL